MAIYNSPNTYEPRFKPKTLVILLFLLLVVVVGGFQVYDYITKGRLTVVTHVKGNVITLSKADNVGRTTKASNITLSSGKSISLSPGNYIIKVTNSGGGSSQVVGIKARDSKKYVIDPFNAAISEPVADVNARYFGVDKSQLLYIDQGTKHLYRIDSSNKLSLVNDLSFTNAYWVNAGFGVGVDIAGTFYVFLNGQAKPLDLPFQTDGNTIFTISPDKQIYIASGGGLYRGTASGQFKRIYSSPRNITGLVAATNNIAVVSSLDTGGSSSTGVTIVDAGGKILASKNIDTYNINWSPSGQYLVTTSDEGSRIYDYRLNMITTVPANNFSHPVWLDDKSVMYTTGDQLWKFSISNERADVIASMPANQSLANVVVSPDASYVYFSAQSTANSNNDLHLLRVGLQGQSVAEFINILHKQLPWLQGGCLLSLTNLTSPTIQIYGASPGDDCVAVAKNFVLQQVIDPAKLRYQVTTVPPNVPVSL